MLKLSIISLATLPLSRKHWAVTKKSKYRLMKSMLLKPHAKCSYRGHMGLDQCPKSWLLMNALCRVQLSGLAIWIPNMPNKLASDERLMQKATRGSPYGPRPTPMTLFSLRLSNKIKQYQGWRDSKRNLQNGFRNRHLVAQADFEPGGVSYRYRSHNNSGRPSILDFSSPTSPSSLPPLPLAPHHSTSPRTAMASPRPDAGHGQPTGRARYQVFKSETWAGLFVIVCSPSFQDMAS